MIDKENASLMLKEEFPEVPFVGTVYGVDLRELEKDDILRAFKLATNLQEEKLKREMETAKFKEFQKFKGI